LSALGYSGVVEYHVGEAIAELRRTDGPFDIVFIDIDKDGYPESLPAAEDKLRIGGLLIIDNMLWGGRIFDADDRTAATQGVRAFTSAITTSGRWIVSLVPIRDGMIVATRVA
jgi:predicted O-methyltransferase YrrM